MAKIKKKEAVETVDVLGIKATIEKAKEALAATVEQNNKLETQKNQLQAQVNQIVEAQTKYKIQFDQQQGYLQALIDLVPDEEVPVEAEAGEEVN